MEPFRVRIPDDVLTDLRRRIRATRWPAPAAGGTWEWGTDHTYLQELLDYWSGEFDWRAQEEFLNQHTQYSTVIDGVRIHFVYARAPTGDGVPLVVTNGWPSCFVELLAVVPLLTSPGSYGIEGPSFDVVIPSLPGYGFSSRPANRDVTTRHTAHLWHRLMQGLGYDHYGAQGGDFGAGVATYMALDRPEAMLGLHLHTLEVQPYLGPGSRPVNQAEQRYLEGMRRWEHTEGGYRAIQSTKPQSLAYGLNDSPAGLAAWILEKWRSWSDSGGDLDSRFSRDFLLTVATIYWVTETMPTSIRDYRDNKRHGTYGDVLGPDDRVHTPTAVAVFANHHVAEEAPPREWAERLYNVQRWTPMPRGGHFAPAEEPWLFSRDVAAFFAG